MNFLFSLLVACPSSVSVEVSADGVNMLPLSTPVVTSGLTYIKIQLVKAEVASAVCLRLHRPRDASTLGLSQIKLLGLTAFGTTSSATVNNPFLPSEDQVSKTRYVFFLFLTLKRSEFEALSTEWDPGQSDSFKKKGGANYLFHDTFPVLDCSKLLFHRCLYIA